MNDEAVVSVHWSFWLFGVIALLWNLAGAMNYLMQMDLEFISAMPETHRAIIIDRPVWATGGFAIGVFGGAVACLLLLFRKASSIYVFIVSLIGILVTMIHTVNVASTKIEFSPGEIFMMILSPIIVASVLIWYAKLSMSKSWIK